MRAPFSSWRARDALDVCAGEIGSAPELAPADVWPFDTTMIDAGGSAIAVSEAGQGPVLLFYTGIGSFIWRDVMVRLSSDFRCITLDPPGIGLSEPVPRADTTLRTSSCALSGVIGALGLTDITLVVHDSAGPPAFAAAAREPARFRGLVGVNTFGWRPAGTAFRAMLAVMGSSVTRQFDLLTWGLARLTSTSFGVGRHLDAASRQAYQAGLQRGMAAFHDYLHDALASDIYAEVTRGMAGPLSALPLLTIFGERNDPLGFQPQWRALFPRLRQVTIPKGNHFPMCDAPQFVADHIRQWHHEYVR